MAKRRADMRAMDVVAGKKNIGLEWKGRKTVLGGIESGE